MKQIIGYKSPFKNKKPSPAKAFPVWALAIPGLLQAGSSLIGAGARKDEFENSRREYQLAKEEYTNMEFSNPYAGLTNPYRNLQNTYEDLTVNQKEANFMKREAARSRANIMQSLKGSAGTSGAASLAQVLANKSIDQNAKIAASIGKQETVINRLKAAEASRLQKLEKQGEYQTDVLRRKGEYQKLLQEQQHQQNLYSMSMDRYMAASDARQLAQKQLWDGLGNSASSFLKGLQISGGKMTLDSFTTNKDKNKDNNKDNNEKSDNNGEENK
tara:strand:+ start:2674 stop:3489 length:816 start_codon:yes stop_codon:yes gene_type:complete